MKPLRLILLILITIVFSGCSSVLDNLLKNPFSGGDDDDTPSAIPNRVTEPTAKYSIAVGGVAPGKDELIIYDSNKNVRDFSGQTLECAADDPIVLLKNRTGYDSVAAGSGVSMIATEAGVTAIRCSANGTELEEVYEITIPPQSLIQILVAEASEQLVSEAKTEKTEDEEDTELVSQDSVSPTANALGSVIRNRISRINIDGEHELFSVDPKDYDLNPPVSYYDAVIMADGQFSPTNSADPSAKIFNNAQDRNFLEGDLVTAYDQAVLTASGIFNGDIIDNTGNAFAFLSPSESEWWPIAEALGLYYLTIPANAGVSDANFPTLAPIQILVHPDVWRYSDARPSFIFIRKRTLTDLAVVNKP